ncbi:GLE1-like protein [Corchorus capsularis]|uniref:mRNA export factor GLE1 n=1 Tax=Corchorus capsularis TaxID=210143 RepID=A0A1R3GQH9_COCAP|nr:GLE1-like protein [Corchorus capsularis]
MGIYMVYNAFLQKIWGAFKLEIRCPQNVNGIGIEPDPDWSFDALLSELDSLEKKLNVSSSVPLPFTKTKPREMYGEKGVKRSPNAFVMKISDEEFEDSESEAEEVNDRALVKAAQFNCDEFYLSGSDDDSDNEWCLQAQTSLMDEAGLVESALFELNHDHQLGVKEDIRNRISALETDLMNESEKSSSAHAKVEKYREARLEVERKFDVQYQRRIAEGLDNHLTAIQRDHELKSQIEERRLRSDAAHEEAKRREKALQEERLRQEKAKAEAEMQAKLKAEEAKQAALEAERRAAKEAAEREAAEALKASTSEVSQREASGGPVTTNSGVLNAQPKGSETDKTNKSLAGGNTLRAAENALNQERERLQKLKEWDERNQSLRSSSNVDFGSTERHIGRLIRQIRGTRDNVRTKATELIKIFNNPQCPQTISIAYFAKKVVSHCESPDNAAFACGYVIVLVTSQFPQAMDLLVAELQRACIYTVPKHISYSKSAFESREAYWKVIGYREEDGKVESTKDYLKRLESYMKLYGALVQTEVPGCQNFHGLQEGWAWLARFLNALPANIYTAVALNAFLQMAGFALFTKYKAQFMKLLNIVSDNFLNALRAQEDPELRPIKAEIQAYLEDKKFLKEPEGRTLQGSLLSSVFVPEADYQESNRYQQSYHQQYSRNFY